MFTSDMNCDVDEDTISNVYDFYDIEPNHSMDHKASNFEFQNY